MCGMGLVLEGGLQDGREALLVRSLLNSIKEKSLCTNELGFVLHKIVEVECMRGCT